MSMFEGEIPRSADTFPAPGPASVSDNGTQAAAPPTEPGWTDVNPVPDDVRLAAVEQMVTVALAVAAAAIVASLLVYIYARSIDR